MKITRKHIFIISGIIGLIALVVIIIKIANTTPKTCDTSGGKKLYCDGENTVCIDCGQGKTYDCDKGKCIVTCDTSGGNTSYCNDTVCAKCGEGQTYDCVGNKKCFCDTSGGNTSYCNDTVCAKCGEGQTYDCVGNKKCFCDTSGGNTSYCEDTVCTKCGEGQTYDCVGNKKCFCDTSTGNTSYCEDTVCAKCGEGQTYDCVGDKKCICDTSTGNTSYCEDTVCAKCGEGQTYDCVGDKKCICDTGYTQCDTICCPDETKVCIGSICCDKEKKCNIDSDGKYTTCCKPGESCIGNACVSNCSGDVPFCGDGTSCCTPGKETCIGNACFTNCPNSVPFCGTGCCAADESCTTGGICCKTPCDNFKSCCYDKYAGKYAVCGGPSNSICSLSKCDNGETLYCNNTVCAKCGVGQTYDCDVTKKCKCDDGHPVLCGADLCCAIGQTCTIDPTKPNPKPNSCCPFGQECGTKNADGSFPSCCLPGYMCDGNGSCVQRCGTGGGQSLNCVYGTNLCIKAENLSDSEKTQLLKDAKTNKNIVDNTVVCDGNDCSFCVVSNQSKFDPQDRQYPEKVGQLSPGSYIIKNTGDNNPGYCTNATVTYSTECNTIGLETNCTLPNCKWVSFIPPTTTKAVDDVKKFYTILDDQFASDENNINKVRNHDITYDYLGVWKNANENAPSSNINIKTGVKTGISDCYTIYNGIDDVEKIIFYDTDPANSSSSEKICLGLSKFTSVNKGKCPDAIKKCEYNDNNNITIQTGCNSDCGSTSYSTGEKWYNQQRSPNGWSCNPLNIDLTDMHVEDTVTSYCPDSLCTIKEWMIQDTSSGNCGKDERTWAVNGTNLSYIGSLPITTLHEYLVTINIINKTQKNMACYCETKNYPSASNATGRYFIPANSSKKIGVQGAQISGSSGIAPFIIYTCKDEATIINGIDSIANFQIYYDSGCSFNNYTVYQGAITSTLNIKTPVLGGGGGVSTSYSNAWCGVDIVFYPSNFHQELNKVDIYHTVDLIKVKQDIYRIK